MNNKEGKKEGVKITFNSTFVFIIIALMIVTLVAAGSPILGLTQFTKDMGKEKIKNEDGTYSIPQDAPVQQNADNKNTYIGRVANTKIQYGVNDYFNKQFSYIYSMQADPYTKYFYTKQVFNEAINRIIGMKKAQDMNMIISKKYLTDAIGKQYYADSEGDIDYDAMRKDNLRINQLANSMKTDLLFENFTYDYFNGLPMSNDEMLEMYKTENTKVTLKYINITNNTIDDNLLKAFYDQNKTNYKMYKLSKMIFKDKKEAEKNLPDIKKNPKNFNETGRKLKVDQKIVNMINDTDYAFLSDLENDNFRAVVKAVGTGDVGNAVIETSQGSVIVKVEDMVDGDFANEKVKTKAKNDYMIKNIKEIEANNKKMADEIYEESKTSGLDKVAAKFKLKVEQASPVAFMDNGIPNINVDATDDRNYVVNVFKGNKGDVMAPFKYQDGYMIASISEKTAVSMKDFEDLYDGMLKKYSSQKAREIENDYYTKARKKYEIINNFDYVITPQTFTPKEEEK